MTEDGWRGRRGRLAVGALAALLVLAGAVALGIGVRAQTHAPQPAAAAGTPTSSAPAPSPSPTPSGRRQAPDPTGPMLPASTPTRVAIPAIGVDSSLLQLGLNPDRTVQVPPLSRDSKAGWYRGSPTPGQLGPSLILGHVDSAEYGPGVFFKLGALEPGQIVEVTRADSTVAVFRIDRVAAFPKNMFPTIEVYGDTRNAQLRLITCGGKFDFSSRSYESNIVVFASLVSSKHA
jgi:sortase (surface protein transpeptidase)